MRKTAIIILLITFVSSIAGQENNESTFFDKHLRPETPEISQFLRYDEMPVSEYTGIPEISIPIYNINVDGLKIPIKLTYHAGGIKVNQEASWVGLGWDLTMGSIVQIINDEDDLNLDYKIGYRNIERMLPDFPDGTQCVSYWPMPTEPPTSINFPIYEPLRKHILKIATDFHVPINGIYKKEGRLFDDYGQFPEYRDSEPDIFKVYLPTGEMLNVVINWDTNKFVVLNKKGYLVARTGSNSWTVTNPYGDKFHFSTYLESYNSINGGFGGMGIYDIRKTTQTWLLSRIVTCNAKEILFEYDVTPVKKADIDNNNYTTATLQQNEIKFNVTYNGSYYVSKSELIDYYPHSYSYDKNDPPPIEGIYYITTRTFESLFHLKKITFPNGQINFTVSPRMDRSNHKKLDKIAVSNNIGDIVNTIDFDYSYFSKSSGSESGRLKLNAVKNNAEQYRFMYDETPLPPIGSYSQDCWGYYNGHPNTSLIPNPSRYKLPSEKSTLYDWVYKPNNNNNMSANLPFTKAGILTEIEFPTGGKVEYDYESNTFDNYVYRVPDYDAGVPITNYGITKGHGLRVKDIYYKDIQGNIVKQEQYQYSDGKAILPKMLFRRRVYRDLNIKPYKNAFFEPTGEGFNVFDKRGFTEDINVNGYNVFNPLSSFDGVGYGIVTKKTISNNVNDNSKIVTNYSNHPDITFFECSSQDALVAIPAFKDDRYWQNGTIEKRTIYDADNIIVKSEDYTYNNNFSPTLYGARVSFYSYCVFLNDALFAQKANLHSTHRNTVSYYPIFDFESLLTNKTTTDYFTGQEVESSETYVYDELNRLKTLTFETANPTEKRITSYTYPRPNQYAEPGLISRNFINEPVVIETKNGTNKSLSYIWKFFINENILGFYDQIHPQFIEKQFGINNPVADRISYEQYDWHNNPIQIRSTDNVPISYVWSYKSAYPILEIRNATYEEAKNAANNNQKFLFEIFDGGLGYYIPFLPTNQLYPSDVEIWQLGETLRTNLPNAEVTTFTYKPLVGVTSITDPSGKTIYYEYDSFNRLQYIKDLSGKIIESYDYHYKN